MRQDITFSALVRVALEQGRTTAELGRVIGLSQPSVSRLARGVSQPGRALEAGMRLIEVVGGEVVLPQAVAQKLGGHGSDVGAVAIRLVTSDHAAPERTNTEAANAA